MFGRHATPAPTVDESARTRALGSIGRWTSIVPRIEAALFRGPLQLGKPSRRLGRGWSRAECLLFACRPSVCHWAAAHCDNAGGGKRATAAHHLPASLHLRQAPHHQSETPRGPRKKKRRLTTPVASATQHVSPLSPRVVLLIAPPANALPPAEQRCH